MANKNNARKSFLIGATVGGVVGAVTALLLAPKPGRELRTDIADQFRSVSGKTQDLARSIGDHTSGLVGKAKAVATSVIEEVRSWKEEQDKEENVDGITDLAATISALELPSAEEIDREGRNKPADPEYML